MRFVKKIAHWASNFAICFVFVSFVGALAYQAYEHNEKLKLHEVQIMCLAENLYHEVRGKEISDEERIMVAMVTIARSLDNDPQWAKTICGVVAQKHQYSWVKDEVVATQRDEKERWAHAIKIARAVYWGFGTKYAFPFGGECTRFYKRVDNRGVGEKSKRFFAKLSVVREFNSHGFHKDPRGCKTPMPTTLSASVAL